MSKRYYRLIVTGYGGESAYIAATPEQYTYWEDQGTEALLEYMLDEDGEIEVPEEADFLRDDDGFKHPWFEAPNEFEHSWGVDFYSGHITVDEVTVDENGYQEEFVADALERIELTDLANNIEEYLIEIEAEDTEVRDYSCIEGDDCDAVIQLYSSEKGCFFDAVIEIEGEFDVNKLRFATTEYPNGEDTLTSISYNGVELDNVGGDTVGKGMTAALWEN